MYTIRPRHDDPSKADLRVFSGAYYRYTQQLTVSTDTNIPVFESLSRTFLHVRRANDIDARRRRR